MARALRWQWRGDRFESDILHQYFWTFSWKGIQNFKLIHASVGFIITSHKVYVCSLKNLASLNFLYRERIKTSFSIIFAKKQINSKRPCQFVKKFGLFEFLYRELQHQFRFSIIFAKKQIKRSASKFLVQRFKTNVSSSKKFCLFEFLYREH